MAFHLAVAAPWQEHNNLAFLGKVEPAAELAPGHRRADDSGQRMPYIGRGYATLGEKGLFKREDREKALDVPAHRLDSPFAPGPDLGGDQIDDRDILLFQSLG